MLKKVISIIMISISIIILFYDKNEIKENNEKIDFIIENKLNSKYDGYIYIPKLDYKNLIKIGNEKEVLDQNLVLMMSHKNVFNSNFGNIVLAGHNNKYVFSIIYNLLVNDEIIISDFKNTYSYNVSKIEYVNIKNKSILDNIYDKKILTLITCTNDNQVRYVVTSKLNHIISHN